MNTYEIYEGDKVVEIYQAKDSVEVMRYIDEEYLSHRKIVTFNKRGNESDDTFVPKDIIRRL